MFDEHLKLNGWEIIAEQVIEPKKQKYFSHTELKLHPNISEFLNKAFPNGLYLHQIQAIKELIAGNNVCISTGTASGKSLPFYISASQKLLLQKGSKVIAIYPMKSLGKEQEERWKDFFEKTNLKYQVGRIDGQVSIKERKNILRKCDVVIMTPDVMHAWFLSNIPDRIVTNFLKALSFIVADEVHTYTGVFGSNCAFLFRRLIHLNSLQNGNIQFICASATISNPRQHLQNLFSCDFALIDSQYDTSPKHKITIVLLNPPQDNDFLTIVSNFIREVSNENRRFIAFVDSRKQTELISSILSRKANVLDEFEDETGNNHLTTLSVLPYRAGYEEEDRDNIQNRLSQGTLKGVISTSALELGLDINGLEIAVLIGVPISYTSLFQRIGRIGRHKEGIVYVINTGTFYDNIIFKHPERLLHRPLAEGALYLENQHIQYIHALCLARINGEHDQILDISESDNSCFDSPVIWPDGFTKLCNSERIGELPNELQTKKNEAGDDPNHVFPLRDAESQFCVYFQHGPEKRNLGSMSFSQVMRESYPGAIYYYMTNAYRVYKVSLQTKEIFVRPEKKYITKPNTPIVNVYPNLTEGNVYCARKYGDLIIFESNLQVREAINGFKEKRGSAEPISYTYPLKYNDYKISYERNQFLRNYFTSGVVITHPLFDDISLKGKTEIIARLLHEAFLISIPFERQDINWGEDKHRIKRNMISKDSRFVAIYDNTYGSLRLSGYVLKENHLSKVIQQAIEIAQNEEYEGIDENIIYSLKTLLDCSYLEYMDFNITAYENTICNENIENQERVILPGSVGLASIKMNEEFIVDTVFYNPSQKSLCYRGRYTTQKEYDTTTIIWPVGTLLEIPGISRIGYYNYDTGEIATTRDSST